MLPGYFLLLHLTLINLHCIHCTSSKVQVYYETNIPLIGSNNLKKCIVENVEFARAVRFDDQSETCERMDAIWNTNRTFISGFTYAWITSYERPFTEVRMVCSFDPLSDMPILGSSSSAANKDMMAKYGRMGI